MNGGDRWSAAEAPRWSWSRGSAWEGGELLSWHQGTLGSAVLPLPCGCQGPQKPPESQWQHFHEAPCKVNPLQPLDLGVPAPACSLSSERPPGASTKARTTPSRQSRVPTQVGHQVSCVCVCVCVWVCLWENPWVWVIFDIIYLFYLPESWISCFWFFPPFTMYFQKRVSFSFHRFSPTTRFSFFIYLHALSISYREQSIFFWYSFRKIEKKTKPRSSSFCSIVASPSCTWISKFSWQKAQSNLAGIGCLFFDLQAI